MSSSRTSPVPPRPSTSPSLVTLSAPVLGCAPTSPPRRSTSRIPLVCQITSNVIMLTRPSWPSTAMLERLASAENELSRRDIVCKRKIVAGTVHHVDHVAIRQMYSSLYPLLNIHVDHAIGPPMCIDGLDREECLIRNQTRYSFGFGSTRTGRNSHSLVPS